MSMPNIPDINPDITLCAEDAKNILLTSIGLEEIALSHILNAEAEKIQSYLGTLCGQKTKTEVGLCELQQLDEMVNATVNNVIKKELLLLMKLEEVNKIVVTPPHCSK